MIIVFVAGFLLREWILQNTPAEDGLNNDAMDIDMPVEAEVGAARDVGPFFNIDDPQQVPPAADVDAPDVDHMQDAFGGENILAQIPAFNRVFNADNVQQEHELEEIGHLRMQRVNESLIDSDSINTENNLSSSNSASDKKFDKSPISSDETITSMSQGSVKDNTQLMQAERDDTSTSTRPGRVERSPLYVSPRDGKLTVSAVMDEVSTADDQKKSIYEDAQGDSSANNYTLSSQSNISSASYQSQMPDRLTVDQESATDSSMATGFGKQIKLDEKDPAKESIGVLSQKRYGHYADGSEQLASSGQSRFPG